MSTGLLNTTPTWKKVVIILTVLIGILYALPNLYGEDPALQIAFEKETNLDKNQALLEENFKQANIAILGIEKQTNGFLIRFTSPETQLKAKDFASALFSSDATVALNLAARTPKWLQVLHANPMKLGLDLRGGVHFLMEIDVDTIIKRREESILGDLKTALRKENLRYTKAAHDEALHGFRIQFLSDDDALKAKQVLETQSQELSFTLDHSMISANLKPTVLTEIRDYTVEQTLTTLRNRVNEMGVAEALVQRQGINRVVVELPGIQDTAQAKELIGKTATLEFMMEDDSVDANTALKGRIPAGSRVAYSKEGVPALLKRRVILTGDSITGATTGFDRDGRPAVNIRLGGGGLELFKKTTRDNIGKRMAVLYLETKSVPQMVDGKLVQVSKTIEEVISLATIQSALGNQFQITGLAMTEAQNLSLLLRAGALPANLTLVEERTLGPSLGAENIRRGVLSTEVGMLIVLIFMAIYYTLFGVVANAALVANLVLLLGVLSVIGATLTLPGIAGIVLTLGMAVDGNVLIFERIREEVRLGMSAQMAIHKGFERAFATILDSNLTTLIVGIVLFTIGSGPIRGFAVVLCVGILTSLFTSVTFSRLIVNSIYGGKFKAKLYIGI